MTRQELRYAAGWALALMLLSTLPYAVVWWFTPLKAFFPGTLYNSDDHGVYFAWMRQAADGHLLFRNLFTTEPQRGVYFHLLFLILGWLSRVPGLDIPSAYHVGRVLCGSAALVLVYCLASEFTADVFRRRCVFWVTALGAGLGWLFWSEAGQATPVDVWQAEALVPTSLYVNAMYAAALALMLGVVLCLLRAEREGPRWAIGAGVCGLVLGNVHSYDVIHLAAAWAAFLIARWVWERRAPVKALKSALIAAAVASPSVAYMAWLYVSEPVFKARADTATWSPRPELYLLGFGLLLPMAIWGFVTLWTAKEDVQDRSRRLLPACWVVAGFLVAYVPFAFQRKMIMGTDLPLGLLAGLAVGRMADQNGRGRGVSAAALIVLLLLTTVRWPLRDVRMAREQNLTSTHIHPAYWPLDDIQAFEWIHMHAPESSALMTFPINGVFGPAYSGRRVWAGHWGETPRYAERFAVATAFYRGTMSSEERRAFLEANGITHVIWSPMEQAVAQPQSESGATRNLIRPLVREPFLTPVFQQGETTVYEFRR